MANVQPTTLFPHRRCHYTSRRKAVPRRGARVWDSLCTCSQLTLSRAYDRLRTSPELQELQSTANPFVDAPCSVLGGWGAIWNVVVWEGIQVEQIVVKQIVGVWGVSSSRRMEMGLQSVEQPQYWWIIAAPKKPQAAHFPLGVQSRVFVVPIWLHEATGVVQCAVVYEDRRRVKNQIISGPISLVQILKNCASLGLRSAKKLSPEKKESVNKSDKEPTPAVSVLLCFPLLLVPLLDYQVPAQSPSSVWSGRHVWGECAFTLQKIRSIESSCICKKKNKKKMCDFTVSRQKSFG